MTDETKKLFDAPWIRCRIEIEGKMQPCVSARTNHTVAISFDEKDANRLARLPEIYEALMEAKNEMFIILNEWALGKSEVDYLASYKEREGKNNYEFFNEIQELLKKVRDGE